jgi:hypothetical protein
MLSGDVSCGTLNGSGKEKEVMSLRQIGLAGWGVFESFCNSDSGIE